MLIKYVDLSINDLLRCSTMNTELNNFIKKTGNAAKAARVLGCSESLLSQILKGKREVSKELAKAITDVNPDISRLRLLYPDEQPCNK